MVPDKNLDKLIAARPGRHKLSLVDKLVFHDGHLVFPVLLLWLQMNFIGIGALFGVGRYWMRVRLVMQFRAS